MSYKRISPIPVIEGGTGAKTFTANGVLLGEGTGAFGVTAGGTTGQVLTGVTAGDPVWASPVASSISITGDTGGALSGNTFTFTANPSAGSSVTFDGAASTITFHVSDSLNNTIIGFGSGNGTLTGQQNVAVGNGNLPLLTSGNYNHALGTNVLNAHTSGDGNIGIGADSLLSLATGHDNISLGTLSLLNLASGSSNICIGYYSGQLYTGSESGNIIIGDGNSTPVGTVGDNGKIRIGTPGSTNACYILGIASVAVSNKEYVTIDTTTGQLGSDAGVSSSISITGDTGGALTGAAFTFSGGTTGFTFNGSGSTETLAADFLSLPTSTSSSTGIIEIGPTLRIHNYGADADANIFFGKTAGNFTLTSGTATNNTGIGRSALNALTTGSLNTIVGDGAGYTIDSGTYNVSLGYNTGNVTSGSYNTHIGSNAGSNTTTSESSNIYIGYNTTGVVSESNALRIGAATGTGSGGLSTAYIQGISSVAVSNKNYVTIDTTTGQLGSDTGPTSFTWSVITADQTAAVNNGYIANKAGTLALALPAVSAVGDIIEVTGINTATGWQITQAAGQQIFFGTSSTTLGATGTLTSTAIRDSIRMVCVVANLTWQILSSVGNITIV